MVPTPEHIARIDPSQEDGLSEHLRSLEKSNLTQTKPLQNTPLPEKIF